MLMEQEDNDYMWDTETSSFMKITLGFNFLCIFETQQTSRSVSTFMFHMYSPQTVSNTDQVDEGQEFNVSEQSDDSALNHRNESSSNAQESNSKPFGD